MSDLRFRRQQQMRTFWPCNGFLSPIVPGPNCPLPAPPTPLPYVPVQHHPYSNAAMVATNVPVADYRGGVRSVHTYTRSFDFQRTEDDRVNSHMGYDESTSSVNQQQNLYGMESEHEFKEQNSSPRGSSTVNSTDSSDPLNTMPLGFSAARLAGNGSSHDSSPAVCNDSTLKRNDSANNDIPVFNGDGTVTISESKYNELTRLALNGSEIAEKLAYTHRNRPCFKKIDSLCARMKQDLIRPDGVLPNINSQGIAWAIKDFIFVFTRIISAWIIIKGYVFNTPDGLNKVKSALCPEFVARFLVWQDATYDFAESLVRSFVSLDNLAQSQKASHQKSSESFDYNTSSPTKSHNGNPLFDEKFEFYDRRVESLQPVIANNLNNNYIYTMVKDSENSQREATVNGTYFKTGTYRPITKDTYREDTLQPNKIAPTSISNLDSNSTIDKNMEVNELHTLPVPDAQMMEASEVLNDYFNEELYQRLATGEIDIPLVEQYLREHLPSNWIDYGTRMFWRMFAERALHSQTAPTACSLSSQTMPSILPLLIDRLMTIKPSDLFFKLQFSKNYFPRFIAKYEDKLTDMRSIVLKSQINGYVHIYEVVHDVRKIFYFAKIYLEFNVDPDLLKAINAFEFEFNSMLRSEPFNVINFDHIMGDPQEHLYMSNIA